MGGWPKGSGVSPLVNYSDGSCPLPKARDPHFKMDSIKALSRERKRLYANPLKWGFRHPSGMQAPVGAYKLTLNLIASSLRGRCLRRNVSSELGSLRVKKGAGMSNTAAVP